MQSGQIYEFGGYRQDVHARTLTLHGVPVPIAPKAFDTLLYLVSNAGRTVDREELIHAVWPDTFVEEGNLNYNISQIRKTLGEYEPGVPYIQTLPKHGYRFVAGVKQVLEEVNGSVRPHGLARARRFRWIWAAVLVVAAGATLAAVWLLRHPDTARQYRATLTPLTSDSGLTMMPALSPDGKLIAYASDRAGDGNLDIWLQQVGGGEALRLTRDPADDTSPAFSPDGGSIAFYSEREGGGIYVVSTLGGEARKIAARGRRPRFSPDGQWIAYWIGPEAWDTSSFFLAPGTGEVRIVPSGGGPSRQIRPEFGAAGYPIWTPDSRHLLFLGNRDPNAFHDEGSIDWWVTPIEGGPVVRTDASAAFRGMGFASVGQAPEAWTPDGAGVLLSAVSADTRNLWRVPISIRDWKVSGVPRRLTFGTSTDVQPSVAGNHVAFASLGGNIGIWSLPLGTGRAEETGPLEPLTHDAVAHSYPAISADGTRLAFSSRRSGKRDIWVRDLRTSKEAVVSIAAGASLNPNFSPDGTRLVYRVAGSAYVVSVDGGGTERICEDCTDYGWSSDQKRLVLVGTSPARISVLDLNTKRRTPLLDHPAHPLWNPRFSPDDRWVAFSMATDNGSQIFVAPFRSGGLIPESEWIAVTDGARDDKPRWSPDGNLLYFVSQRDRFRCIWAQGLDAGKHPAGPPIPIFHAHEARRSLGTVGVGDLAISVARDRIVFNMSERTGNLWMTNLDGR